MFTASSNDEIGQVVCALITKAIPPNQSLKEDDFDWYVEDLQEEIITHFNYHKLQEVPLFIDKILSTTLAGAKTDDKKRRYAAGVCLATIVNLFPFDDFIPQFEPIVMQLLRPGFKRLVIIGAKVVGYIGHLTGPNRNHLIKILVEKHAAILHDASGRPENLFAAAVIMRELAITAPEHIFALEPKYVVRIIENGLYSHDPNVRDTCLSIIASLFSSHAASVDNIFLTDFLDIMRTSSIRRLSSEQSPDDLIAIFKLLKLLLPQRPYLDEEIAQRTLFPACSIHFVSTNFEVMKSAIETITFLHTSEIIITEDQIIQTIVAQLFGMMPKQHKDIEPLFVHVIYTYPEFFRKEFEMVIDQFNRLLAFLSKNTGPIVVFRLVVATIEVITDKTQLNALLEIVNNIMIISTVPTPIHMLLKALNESHQNWDKTLHNYKAFLVRLIHEEMGEPFQRWEAAVITLNAIDQLNHLNYPDAVMLHSLVMGLITSPDWQVRERVASSAIHLFEDYMDRMPIETMQRLVDLAVTDNVRSVRKRSLFAFKPIVYEYLAQPEIVYKFSRLIYDESYSIRKHSIKILGALIPHTSASILRELLLTTLRQLPDKYNPIIPPRISDIFPQLISASTPVIRLYADAIFQRFLRMLNERFSTTTSYKDPSLVYMNSAQLRDIDGSLIKSLSRLNELCPDIVLSGPVINVLTKVLAQPVHPWTKMHALKALKNIAQGEHDIMFIWRDHFQLIESLLKIIRENASTKLVTRSLKVLGSISACAMPTMLTVSSRKNFFIFRSFFSGTTEFRRYFIRLLFIDLLEIFIEPMIDTKRETIAGVLTKIFVADPDSIPQYLPSFFQAFLPMFPTTNVKTLRKFLDYLTEVVRLAGRQIMPHATSVYHAIENLWRQQLTIEGSRVISALIIATHGQCDSILHLVVPICFQLIRFKNQSSAYELFKLLRTAADYSPSYLTTIVEGISDLAQTPETSDEVIGYCIKTLSFIVDNCDCDEHLPTIKRCVLKLKSNSRVKYREAASGLVIAIEERNNEDDTTEFDDDYEARPLPPVVSCVDAADITGWMQLPDDLDDDSLGKWFRALELRLIQVAPSPVVRALEPLNDFPGLLPNFTFTFAFLTTWQNLSRHQKNEITVLLNAVFKCTSLPNWIAKYFVNLAEFSILAEIDIRLDFTALIPFCEAQKFYAKALFFLDFQPSTFPFTKLIHLNSICGRKLEARALANRYSSDMDFKLWIELGEWEKSLDCIRKTLDPSRFVQPQIICKAATEDWDGILDYKDAFYDLPLHDRVEYARYFMTAEIFMGEDDDAKEFFDMTSGFSVEDQIMRSQMFIRQKNIAQASQSIQIGWRYLAATVSAIPKCNKNQIQDYIFQAQQLLELDEVVWCLEHPEDVDETDKVWRGRLKLIQNQPDRQKELFKIRSLVPNLPHFDAHMLNVISYYIWLGQRDVARRLGDVFFPDEDSPHAKYVQLELSGREEKIDEMLSLARSCNNKELRSRLLQLVGNIRLKKASTVDSLKDVVADYIAADKSYEKIGNTYLLIAHAANDVKAASLGVQAIGKSITMKPVKGCLFANQIMGALANFGADKEVSDAVSIAVGNLTDLNLASVFYTAFSMLLHSNPNINEVAMVICIRLVSKYPQYVSFQLLMMEKDRSDVEHLENLYDKLQMDHPVTFSHVSMIYKELQKIAGSLFHRFNKALTDATEAFQESDNKAAMACFEKFARQMSDPTLSIHDKQLFSGSTEKLRNIWNGIKSRGEITQEDLDAYKVQLSILHKKYNSIRVIRLSSVADRLEKQQKWDLYLPGSQSLLPNGVKIAKFFHSLGNHENGFLITIIGVDGKRYNFQLRRVKRLRPLATEQLVDLIGSMIEDQHHVKHGSIIQLTEHLHLFEVPKGQVSMYELVTVYMQSKGRIMDAEPLTIREWAKADYSDLNLESRVMMLKNLRKYFEGGELSHALLVTSKDAEAWAYRTSHFSSSLGAMSAIAFLIGSVDHSPRQILIDKMTGSVTFNNFADVSPDQAVPFRLTPMILNALGRCQVNGPFKTYFIESMKEIRKRASAIAPFLQFVCREGPFEKTVVPAKFLKSLGAEPSEDSAGELDELYNRIYGEGVPLEEELSTLIQAATDITNLAKMLPTWYPWW